MLICIQSLFSFANLIKKRFTFSAICSIIVSIEICNVIQGIKHIQGVKKPWNPSTKEFS